ncbi:cupin domain-containing protein [Paucibacter sp. APW11]|uniref:Cupin domain-containing protein n=1 Tax=Roseateles aquae TaxID=3077235 RepID=A0ABU3PA78_9BURK|nr:cupin domain-containing protein [Paucibacter sp. APW11]MDT8999486.1 cupin domain-containing protein [Paucibacter sp. APW11]
MPSPLNETSPAAPQPCLVRAGHSHEGAPLAVGADRWMVNVPAAATGQALSVMSWQGHAPGGPPLHLHPEQDEVFIVDEGEYRFQCGEAQFLLKAGDSIFLPRGVPHTFRQLGPVGRLRFLYTPAGQMEDFFAALSRLEGPPTPEAAHTLFAAHGMRVVAPPLAD